MPNLPPSSRAVAEATRNSRFTVERFVSCIENTLLPPFRDLETRAHAVSEEYFHNEDSSNFTDPEDFADVAWAKGLEWFQETEAIRQGVVNLLSAGLYHLVEYQIRSCGALAVLGWTDTKALPSGNVINELRLVANVVKHADGKSADALRKISPDLFVYPALAGYNLPPLTKLLGSPLSGMGLYVSEARLQLYCRAAISIFEELAQQLDSLSEK